MDSIKTTTVVIPRELSKDVKRKLIDSDHRNFTALINHLLTEWVKSQKA